MNEHLTKLAQHSGFEFDKQDCNFYHSDSAQYLNAELMKFAKLIVIDCLGVYQAVDNGNKPHGTDDFAEAIRLRYEL